MMIRFYIQLGLILGLATIIGCGAFHDSTRGMMTPAQAGLNTRDLIDPPAQADSDRITNIDGLTAVSQEVKQMLVNRAAQSDPNFSSLPPRNVLCLSGGGAYGAFSAGILCGWTETGTRPEFDTVTGISTGALIAPLAFLGPKYDADMKRFYTQVKTKDIYIQHPIRGLFTDALADNSPLAQKVDEVLTPQLIEELGNEHRKGRRLYVGTTELESKRFVVWDLTAIACREGYAGKDLIKRIMLGSSAIPGFFPPSKIPVTVDGRLFYEKHGDGGVSQGVFCRPPFIPDTGDPKNPGRSLAGTNIYCIMAGKLYADPAPLKHWSLSFASTSVSAVIYAQSRGDLVRIYTVALLAGMNFHMTAIPEGFDAPPSATDFNPGPMTRMFDEGKRLIKSKEAWRTRPPGCEPGETVRERDGTTLVEQKRGPDVNTQRRNRLGTPGLMPIPAVPGSTEKRLD